MAEIGTLVIRADAGPEIGAGHVMRCLALAQAWQDKGGRCVFVTGCSAGSLVERLNLEGMDVCEAAGVTGSREDIEKLIAVARDFDAAWVVLDGYKFTAKNQKDIKDAGLKLLCVDDNTDYAEYYADIILNQNIHACEEMYPSEICQSYTKRLLGLKYCLLRRKFLAYRGNERKYSKCVCKIMLTMGGADPENVTGKFLEAFSDFDLDGLQVRVIVGANNKNYQLLKKQVNGLDYGCEIIFAADDEKMVETMLWADVSVSAAGSTVWEHQCLGVPTILVAIAQNQKAIAENARNLSKCLSFEFNKQGSVDAGELFSLVTHDWFADEASCPVDSSGWFNTKRVVAAMLFGDIIIRRVESGDAQMLFKWACDPQVRQNSFNSAGIKWEDHVAWLESRINSDDCRIYLAISEYGKSLGVVRFDCGTEQEAIISITLAPEVRGYSLAASVICCGVSKFYAECGRFRVVAKIKPSNIASQHSFIEAGFSLASSSLGELSYNFN